MPKYKLLSCIILIIPFFLLINSFFIESIYLKENILSNKSYKDELEKKQFSFLFFSDFNSKICQSTEIIFNELKIEIEHNLGKNNAIFFRNNYPIRKYIIEQSNIKLSNLNLLSYNDLKYLEQDELKYLTLFCNLEKYLQNLKELANEVDKIYYE